MSTDLAGPLGSDSNAVLGRHLEVRDRPGVMKASLMRHYFEGAVMQTATLAATLPLDRVVVAGEFQEYMRPETQAAWVGFALGMRCAERLQAAVDAQALGVGYGVDRAA